MPLTARWSIWELGAEYLGLGLGGLVHGDHVRRSVHKVDAHILNFKGHANLQLRGIRPQPKFRFRLQAMELASAQYRRTGTGRPAPPDGAGL
jgi:hypothetical protein